MRATYGCPVMDAHGLPPLPQAWTAVWIEPRESPGSPAQHRPAYHVAGEFDLPGSVASARLWATAHGVYEAFINGVRVGDIELTPGFTAYRKHLQVHCFDVTHMLRRGRNALGAILSDGWWRGQHGVIREIDAYGPDIAFLAELQVTLGDGRQVTIGTDGSWSSTVSHILAADLIAGEVHDMRRRIPAWSDPGTDRSRWDSVNEVAHPTDVLCAVVGPPVRRVGELAPVSVTEIAPRRHVIDFGQNSNGWARLTNTGPAGNEVTLTYGEWITPDGDVTQENVANGAFASPRGLPFQTDRVVSAGDGSVFEPRHSTKGFRFVRVEGLAGPLDPDSITSIVVHTDLRQTGDFQCSDARVNRLHLAADWSFRGNACEIPTDCPTRERSGWTGDWQIYVGAAAYMYDVTDWSAKWLRDLAADQFPDGKVTSVVPDPSPGAPVWSGSHGSAGWGDAAVHVPWELHLATGRVDILESQFESMCRWVDFAARRAAGRRHPSRVERWPEPLPHEKWLWDSGWHYGEWLEPGADIETDVASLIHQDHGAVATAYLYRSADQLARISALLGREEESDKYAALALNVLDAWRTEFIDIEGHVTPRTQATLCRAIAFGLIPESLRRQTADDLVRLIEEAGMHLGTGFLATPLLLPVLAENGHLDTAYSLLFQDTAPSWMHMSDQYTTIWEDWDGISAGKATHSLNHYSKGAVISFLHGYVAGLVNTGSAYRRVRIAPRPGGGINWARTHHDAPHGRVSVEWRIESGTGTLTCTLPEGTEGELHLPDGTMEVLHSGAHTRLWADDGA
ncbi:MAG: family 78 glycoside hydrolase catalytic domain [Actinomycetota bacterium]